MFIICIIYYQELHMNQDQLGGGSAICGEEGRMGYVMGWVYDEKEVIFIAHMI